MWFSVCSEDKEEVYLSLPSLVAVVFGEKGGVRKAELFRLGLGVPGGREGVNIVVYALVASISLPLGTGVRQARKLGL